MKIAAVVILAGMSAVAGRGEGIDRPEAPTVVVCVAGSGSMLLRAQATVSSMFADIGVRIDWRAPCPAEDQAIKITWAGSATELESAGVLALALPYEGKRIEVFLWRLWRAGGYAPSALLAHVLAHEIGHILQGVIRHSESGIMKAQFGPKDIALMAKKPLSFGEADAALIHDGLGSRSTRLMALKHKSKK